MLPIVFVSVSLSALLAAPGHSPVLRGAAVSAARRQAEAFDGRRGRRPARRGAPAGMRVAALTSGNLRHDDRANFAELVLGCVEADFGK